MIKKEQVTIRNVRKSEVSLLLEIAKSTFIEAYASTNDATDFAKYLLENFHLEKFQTEFDNPESQFFFAEFQQQIIGYLKVNQGKAQTDSKLSEALEIERIYVRAAFQGKSVGRLFLQKATQIAKAEKLKTIWLGVWEKNPKAIRFYEKNGFSAFDKHLFQLGDDPQIDIMMKLELG